MKDEMTIMWEELVEQYNEDRFSEKRGAVLHTLQELLKKYSAEQLGSLLHAYCCIRNNDGRLSERNKQFFTLYPVDEKYTCWNHENPLVYGGLDNIHPAHVDQLMDELRKLAE